MGLTSRKKKPQERVHGNEEPAGDCGKESAAKTRGCGQKRFQVVVGAKPGVVPSCGLCCKLSGSYSTGTVALRHNVPVNGFFDSFHHSND